MTLQEIIDQITNEIAALKEAKSTPTTPLGQEIQHRIDDRLDWLSEISGLPLYSRLLETRTVSNKPYRTALATVPLQQLIALAETDRDFAANGGITLYDDGSVGAYIDYPPGFGGIRHEIIVRPSATTTEA